MYGKRVSGEEMKRGGKEQHSKIGPVNNGEDVAEAWLCVGRADESGTNARCGGAAGAREREECGGLGSSYTTRNRTTNGFHVPMFPKTEGTCVTLVLPPHPQSSTCQPWAKRRRQLNR